MIVDNASLPTPIASCIQACDSFHYVWRDQTAIIELTGLGVHLTLCFMSCNGFNALRPRQNGRDFADDIFKCIFMNENVWIPIKISMKFVPRGPINNIPALVQIIAWRRAIMFVFHQFRLC